jgi:hypothetical protein
MDHGEPAAGAMITVLLPTYRRPDMLREALRSVAAQTARAEIGTVVVSENSGDRRSAEVAAEFSALPIQYLQRQPPLPPIDHGRALYTPLWPTEFVAILHDDDWWRPEHLAHALQALRSNQGATGYAAAAFTVHGPVSRLGCDSNLLSWMGAGFPPFERRWQLGRAETLLACLPGTPRRYSSMVLRSRALHAASRVFDRDNPYDTDRLLTISLSAEGPMIYEPLPAVCVRYHPAQDHHAHGNFGWLKHMRATGEYILDLAESERIDLRGMLVARLATCPAPEQVELLRAFGEPWCLPLLTSRRLAPDSLVEHVRRQQAQPQTWKDQVKEFLPPVVMAISRRWRPPPLPTYIPPPSGEEDPWKGRRR